MAWRRTRPQPRETSVPGQPPPPTRRGGRWHAAVRGFGACSRASSSLTVPIHRAGQPPSPPSDRRERGPQKQPQKHRHVGRPLAAAAPPTAAVLLGGRLGRGRTARHGRQRPLRHRLDCGRGRRRPFGRGLGSGDGGGRGSRGHGRRRRRGLRRGGGTRGYECGVAVGAAVGLGTGDGVGLGVATGVGVGVTVGAGSTATSANTESPPGETPRNLWPPSGSCPRRTVSRTSTAPSSACRKIWMSPAPWASTKLAPTLRSTRARPR